MPSLYSDASRPRHPDAQHEETVISRLCSLGGEALGTVAATLFASPRFADAFGRAVQAALEAKGRIDRNVQMVLGLMNLPSRADLTRIATKLEAMQGSLVNLNLKVDRLLAVSKPRRRTSRKSGSASQDAHE